MRVVNPNPQEYRNPLTFPVKMLCNKGTPLTDLWLPVRINGDMAVLKGIMKEMLAEEESEPGSVFEREFIENSTVGYDAFIADLRATTWEDIWRSSGLDARADPARPPTIAMRSKRIIACWAMGLTQHKNAVGTIQEVMNFLLLGGHIGRPGAGPCPVRGHSNVQGDRTMGIWERMNDKFMDKLGEEFGFQPPREHGTDTVEAHQAHARRQDSFLPRHGRQLPLRHAGHRIHGARVDELPGDRARFHEAEPLPSHHRRDRSDPAVPRSHRDRPAGERRAVCHRRGFDGRHHPRRAASSSRRATISAAKPPSSPGSPARRSASAPRCRLGGIRRGLRPHPRPHRARDRPASSATTSASRRTSFICRTRRATGGSSTTASARRSSRPDRSRVTSWSRVSSS